MRNALAIPVLASVGTLEYESRADFRRRKYAWLTGPLGRRSLLWLTLIVIALAAGTAGAYSYREGRRSANRVRCLSGLRFIGRAMQQYQYTSLAADFGKKPTWQIERSRCENELASLIERARLRRAATAAVPAGPMRGQVLEFWQDERRRVYYVRPPEGPGEGPLWQAGPFVSPP